MTAIDWSAIEKTIEKGEMTLDEVFNYLKSFVSSSIEHYENIIVEKTETSRYNPAARLELDAYRKKLSEFYKAMDQLNIGQRIEELPEELVLSDIGK